MSKKKKHKKSSNEDKTVKVLLLITGIINLMTALTNLIKAFIG